MPFMTSRGIIDDPGRIPDHFFEQTIRLTRTKLRELVPQLAEGPLRRHLDALLRRSDWDVNREALRMALANHEPDTGARLVTGSHLRVR
jgi:hypothetical protein